VPQAGGQAARWILYHHTHLVERCIRTMRTAVPAGSSVHPLAQHTGGRCLEGLAETRGLWLSSSGATWRAFTLCCCCKAFISSYLLSWLSCRRVGRSPDAAHRRLHPRALHAGRPSGAGAHWGGARDGATGADRVEGLVVLWRCLIGCASTWTIWSGSETAPQVREGRWDAKQLDCTSAIAPGGGFTSTCKWSTRGA